MIFFSLFFLSFVLVVKRRFFKFNFLSSLCGFLYLSLVLLGKDLSLLGLGDLFRELGISTAVTHPLVRHFSFVWFFNVWE